MNKTIIIAEAGVNHNGSIELAKQHKYNKHVSNNVVTNMLVSFLKYYYIC